MGSLPTISAAGSAHRAMSKYDPSTGAFVEKVLLEDFDDGHASYSKESGTYTDVTDPNLTGTQSIKMELAAGQNASVRKASYSLNLAPYWGFGVKLYIPEELCHTGDHTSINFNLLLSADSGFTNYYHVGPTVVLATEQDVNIDPGWNFFNFAKSDFTKVGSPAWETTTFQMIRVRATLTGGTGTKWFVVDSVYGIYGYRPIVIFTFDDGALSQYENALPIMEDYGIKGTAFLIATEADTAANMTTAQMVDLQDTYGWTLGSHTYYHETQDSVSLARSEESIVLNQQWMQDNGMRGWRYFAYPQGNFTWESKAMTDGYHDLVRTSLATTNQHTVWRGNELASKKLIRIQSVGDADSASTVKGYINTAVTRCDVCVLNFHNIKDSGEGGTGLGNAVFAALCEHVAKLRDSNVLDVMTFEEYERSLNGQRWKLR